MPGDQISREVADVNAQPARLEGSHRKTKLRPQWLLAERSAVYGLRKEGSAEKLGSHGGDGGPVGAATGLQRTLRGRVPN